MSIQRNKQLVRQFYEQVVSTGDINRVSQFVAPSCVELDGERRVPSGTEGMIAHIQGVRGVYPDLEVAINRQIAEGDLVATEIIATGTHTGEWLGIGPTGKRLVFTGVNIDRVVDGRIVEHGGAANMLGPLLAAGAIRPNRA
jgi:predicted ester cyclase